MRVMKFPKTTASNESGSFRAAWKMTAGSLGKLAARMMVTAPALFAISAGSAADQTPSYPRMVAVEARMASDPRRFRPISRTRQAR